MKNLSPLNRIILIVVSLHFLIVMICSIGFSIHPPSKPPIIIRSIIPNSTTQKVSATPKPKVKKQVPKQEKKTALQQKPVQTTKTTEKISPKPVQQAKNTPQKKPVKPNALNADSLFIPTLTEPTKTEHPEEKKEEKISYDQILLYLESMIVLPVKGLIKVKLRINEQCQIDAIEILECNEKENERYLVETLNHFEIPLEQKFPQPNEIIVTFRGF
jgi:hypothetical protein